MRRETTACLLALLTIGRVGRAQAGGAHPEAAAATSPSGLRTAPAHLIDAQSVRKRLGLVPEYENLAGIGSVKIAVLDHGFDGVGSGRPYLPGNALLVENYDPDFVRRHGLGDPDYRKPFEPLNRHGRIMAQIIWAVTGNQPGGPRFYLLNANGPTMLRRAVRYAIEQKVDIILFSGSFEGGGNGDGRGFINRIVDEALGADILWINAAGNYGRHVYNGAVRVLSDGYLRLRDGSDVASLRFRNRLDENQVTVTLTWNDYRDQEDAGTEKDLDLYVEDWAGRRIGAGEKVQVSGARVPGPDESRNPRERVVLTNLPAGPDLAADPDYTYRIRVRAKKGRFTASDRVRILLTASREVYAPPGSDAPREAIEFVDATREGELYPPADHPLVLTVGDSGWDSSVGPTADHRVKPDAVLDDSRAFFSDGQATVGSSNAAAYLAGVVAVLKVAEPGLRTRHLLLLARQGTLLSRTATPGVKPGQPAASATQFADSRPPGQLQVGPASRPRPAPNITLSPLPNSRTPAYTGPSVPPPATPPSSQPAPSIASKLRFWRTPTRARLAETLREGR
jgi:hypothetical protein